MTSVWVSNCDDSKRASTDNAPQTRTAATNSVTKPFREHSIEDIRRLVIEAQMKRAEKGDAQASYDLANRYITEDGVLKDYAEAKRLLEQAVKNADSQTLRDKAQTQLDKLNKVLGQ
ncbi:MAG: hypothetical protein RLZZ265_769 [Verrucomicrobiota bacterium]